MKYIVLSFIVVGFIGCNSNNSSQKKDVRIIEYPNGSIKTRKVAVENDSINWICKDYYPDGKIKSTYSMKDSMYHGYNINYYENGKIDFEGNWVFGKKDRKFIYYDSTGFKNKVVNYIEFRDTNIARPNEIIYFNQYGDTIFDKSLFLYLYSDVDIIKAGKPYILRIKLRGHIFPYAYVCFCDFDEKYRQLSDRPCYTIEMGKQLALDLPIHNYNIGENVLRGYILNTKEGINSNKILNGEAVQVYFTHKFYVQQ